MSDKAISINLPLPQRIVPMQQPTKPVTFEEWREVIRQNFPDCVIAAEVALAITAQLLISDIMHPFALVIVGPPSSGKTTTLNFFSDLDGVSYITDKFTSASFVSHALNTKAEVLAKNDLLPKIRRKAMIVRDFATVFSKRDDDLRETIGTMTRLLDGEGLITNSGPHGERGYAGDYSFMFLAASTPIKKNTWQLMANLGSRLFFLQFQPREKSTSELMEQLSSHSSKVKEELCRSITKELLRNMWHTHPQGIEWDRKAEPNNVRKLITQCAQLLACARSNPGTVNPNEKNKPIEEHEEATIEQPDRLSNLLYNLIRGRALSRGREHAIEEDLWIVLRITFDSMPPTRALMIKELVAHGGELSTTDVEHIYRTSKPTALVYMKIMERLGICTMTNTSDGVGRPQTSIILTEKFKWLVSDETKQLINTCSYSK